MYYFFFDLKSGYDNETCVCHQSGLCHCLWYSTQNFNQFRWIFDQKTRCSNVFANTLPTEDLSSSGS